MHLQIPCPRSRDAADDHPFHRRQSPTRRRRSGRDIDPGRAAAVPRRPRRPRARGHRLEPGRRGGRAVMGIAGAHAAAAAGAGGRAARADGPYGGVHLRPSALLRRAARRRRPRRPCGVSGVPRAGRAARGGGDVHAVRDGVPRRRAAPDAHGPHPDPARRRPPLHPRRRAAHLQPGRVPRRRSVGAAPPARRGPGPVPDRRRRPGLGPRARRAGRAGRRHGRRPRRRPVPDAAAGRRRGGLGELRRAARRGRTATGHRPLPRRGHRARRPGRPRRRRHRPCDVRQLRHPGPQRSLRHTGRRLPAAPQLHEAHHARRGRELQQPPRQRGELGRRRLRVHRSTRTGATASRRCGR